VIRGIAGDAKSEAVEHCRVQWKLPHRQEGLRTPITVQDCNLSRRAVYLLVSSNEGNLVVCPKYRATFCKGV
jgi:hypothetical protein